MGVEGDWGSHVIPMEIKGYSEKEREKGKGPPR